MIIRLTQRRLASTLSPKLAQGLEQHVLDTELFEKIKASKIPAKLVTQVSEFKYKKEGFADAKEFKEVVLTRAGFRVEQGDKILSSPISKIAEIAAASARAQEMNAASLREWLRKPSQEQDEDDEDEEIDESPEEVEVEETEAVGEPDADTEPADSGLQDPTLQGIDLGDIPEFDDGSSELQNLVSSEEEPLPETDISSDINFELPQGMSLDNLSEDGYTPDPDTQQQTETLSQTLTDRETSSVTEQTYVIKRDPKIIQETSPDKRSIRRSLFFIGGDKLRVSGQASEKSYTLAAAAEPDVTGIVHESAEEEGLFVVDPEQPLDARFMELSELLPRASPCLSVTWAQRALDSFVKIKNDKLCNRPQQLSLVLRSLAMARLTNKGGADFETTRPLSDLIDYSVFYGRNLEVTDTALLQLHSSKSTLVALPTRSKKSSFPPPSPESKVNIGKLEAMCNSNQLISEKEWSYLYSGLTPYIGDLIGLILSQTERAVKKAHTRPTSTSEVSSLDNGLTVSRSVPRMDTLIGFNPNPPTESDAQTSSVVDRNVTVARISTIRETALTALVDSCKTVSWLYEPLGKGILSIDGMTVRLKKEGKSNIVARLTFKSGEVRMLFKQPNKELAAEYIMEAIWPTTEQTISSRGKPEAIRWYTNTDKTSMTWRAL